MPLRCAYVEGHEPGDCECFIILAKHKEKYGEAQEVVVIPKATSKGHVFISRLVVLNEAFAALTPNCIGGNILML